MLASIVIAIVIGVVNLGLATSLLVKVIRSK